MARLTANYRELGFSPQQAERRARLLYATYVGLLQMADSTPNEWLDSREIAALVRELRGTSPRHPRARAFCCRSNGTAVSLM